MRLKQLNTQKKSVQFYYFGHVVSYNGTNETLTSTQTWKLQRGNLHHLQVSHLHSAGWRKGRQTRHNTVHLTLKLTSAQVVETTATTVIFKTTLTRTITQYELLILLGSNHLL